jgi:hypothetical protein
LGGLVISRLAAAGFVTGLRLGDWVSLHWDCDCERLSRPQLLALRRLTARHLRLANAAPTERTSTTLADFRP